MNTNQTNDEIRKAVSQHYQSVAQSADNGCFCGGSSCCSDSAQPSAQEISSQLGYSREELSAAPQGSNLGLGCGNPQAIASLKVGETVLDLGSGAGFDSFLAARQVGPTGRVIGVDLTPEMILKARTNAGKAGFQNVEFRLGEIEHLPVADDSIDVIISNCVINLSPDKARVFAEAWRVLKPGGRLAISDVVAQAELPEDFRRDLQLVSCCVGGAEAIPHLQQFLQQAGFTNIRISPRPESSQYMADWAPGLPITDYVVSAEITAEKPQQA